MYAKVRKKEDNILQGRRRTLFVSDYRRTVGERYNDLRKIDTDVRILKRNPLPVQQNSGQERLNAIIQKCGDDDSEYILDSEEEAAIAEEDLILDEAFEKEWTGLIESIPPELILQYSNSDCYGGTENTTLVEIEMTKSRSGDKAAAWAALKSKTGQTHASSIKNSAKGYVWHHIPDKRIPLGILRCNMVLIKADIHKQKHIGAVKQYENYARKTDKHFRYGK